MRATRIVVSLALFCALTLLFVFPSVALTSALAGVAWIQWMPSAVRFSLGLAVGWLAVTLLMGRIYCSAFCPFGTLQDILSRLLGKPERFRYHPARPRLRNFIVIVTVLTLMLGITAVGALLDPYSALGRILHNIFVPLARWQWPVTLGCSLLGIALAWLTLGVVAAMAVRRGRLWCNTICPVGTAMGYISRNSIMRIDIDTDLCVHCGRCERVCKAECIDLTDHVVDMSRCVVCFDCTSICPNDAIRYTYTRKQLSLPMMQSARPASAATANNMSRRSFIIASLAAGTTAAMRGASIAGPDRLAPVSPPGVTSRKLFLSRCTACGLCIDQCSGGVLKASVNEYGWLHALQPVMDFDRGSCLTTCNACTRLCPTGAIEHLSLDEKNRFIIGTAEVDTATCVGCGRCVRACPHGAVTLVDRKAVVDPGLCVGCGACQHVCPVRPVKSIRVHALLV